MICRLKNVSHLCDVNTPQFSLYFKWLTKCVNSKFKILETVSTWTEWWCYKCPALLSFFQVQVYLHKYHVQCEILKCRCSSNITTKNIFNKKRQKCHFCKYLSKTMTPPVRRLPSIINIKKSTVATMYFINLTHTARLRDSWKREE